MCLANRPDREATPAPALSVLDLGMGTGWCRAGFLALGKWHPTALTVDELAEGSKRIRNQAEAFIEAART